MVLNIAKKRTKSQNRASSFRKVWKNNPYIYRMKEDMEQLKNALSELNIEADEILLKKFESYMDEILKWNEHVNLTAITDRKDFVQKHFVDSILGSNCEEMISAEKVVDLGTGAGFPGVPLALIFPEKKFLLIDSLNKRLKIISEICEKLEIKNVEVLHGRAEEIGRMKDHREQYDLCVSRAVANFSTLSEYCLPLVKKGGYFMAYKGPDAEAEIKASGKACGLLGGKISRIFIPELKGFEFDHNIVIVKKEKNTPAKFPRKAGTPAKEPLK